MFLDFQQILMTSEAVPQLQPLAWPLLPIPLASSKPLQAR